MAKDDRVSTADLAYADTLWKVADALRGQVDAAGYRHVVLGLLFLKYSSDSFESRRDQLQAELTKDGIKGRLLEALLEIRDEYTAEPVFWVPPESRRPNLQNQATRPDIATLIDDAILAVERDNPNLKNKLPRDYTRRGIAPEKMTGLINLIAFKGTATKPATCSAGCTSIFRNAWRGVPNQCARRWADFSMAKAFFQQAALVFEVAKDADSSSTAMQECIQ